MARKATSSSKTRTARQKTASAIVSKQNLAVSSVQGRRTKEHDAASAELSLPDAFFPGGDEPLPDAPNLEQDGPVKARRGRKPKVQPAPDPAGSGDDTLHVAYVSAEPADATAGPEHSDLAAGTFVDATPEAPPAKARRGRPPKARPVEQPSTVAAEEPAHAAKPVTGSSAAKWDPATGTATFDWPAIEQVAATEGPNQAIARLLLAARAEGANSRWPF